MAAKARAVAIGDLVLITRENSVYIGWEGTVEEILLDHSKPYLVRFGDDDTAVYQREDVEVRSGDDA